MAVAVASLVIASTSAPVHVGICSGWRARAHFVAQSGVPIAVAKRRPYGSRTALDRKALPLQNSVASNSRQSSLSSGTQSCPPSGSSCLALYSASSSSARTSHHARGFSSSLPPVSARSPARSHAFVSAPSAAAAFARGRSSVRASARAASSSVARCPWRRPSDAYVASGCVAPRFGVSATSRAPPRPHAAEFATPRPHAGDSSSL